MRSRAPWPQMAVATVLVMVLPAVIVGGLSALGVITSVWLGVLLAVALSLAFTSAGSAYWRRRSTGDVLFSDLLLWGWLRRRRTERRLGRADELLRQAGDADSSRKAELLRELGAALDAQDPYLDGHSRRVARYVTMIAQRMNLPSEQVERAKAAATIHDVGKLRVPEEVVHKPGRLTDAEFELMKQHAAAGGVMVECLGDPALAAAVRGHHERWDGSGYPDGLAGERIPGDARIISVADTFDAITSARSYRAATPHAKALEVIADEAGQQLDPEAARAFISCYTDRRGAALWAGLASIPRQLAGRLSISPAELTGAFAAALAPAAVVVAGAAASTALPAISPSKDDPASERAAAIATPEQGAEPTDRSTTGSGQTGDFGAVAGAEQSAPVQTPEAGGSPGEAPGPATPPGSTGEQAGDAGPGNAARAPPGAGEDASPPLGPQPSIFATPTVTPTSTPSATPTPEPPPPDLTPDFPGGLPEEPPPHGLASCDGGGWIILGYPSQGECIADAERPELPPEPAVTPAPTPLPTPTPTAEPEPTPTPEPEPTPDPPLLPDLPPIFPPPSHTRDDCKDGGWMDLGYPNQGQCVADADKHRPDHPDRSR